MRKRVEVFVPGVPVTEGSTRAFVSRSGKAVVTHDRDDELKRWRGVVAVNVYRACRGQGWELPLDEPVIVGCVFYLPKPKRPRFGLAATKPDLDKLQRAVGDALAPGRRRVYGWVSWLTAGCAVLVEDSRIVEWRASKRYTDEFHPVGVSLELIRESKRKAN